MRHATLVLTSGKIITLDNRSTIARAVAIDGERILAVGTDAEIQPLIGPETRVIDLAGRAAIPGLVDAHAHMDREGLKEALPSMAGLRSVGDVCDRIADLVRAARPGEWIVTMPVGDPPEFEITQESFRERRWPTRHDLDRVAPNNPVYIKSAWGYWRVSLPLVSFANSRALKAAGVSRDSKPPAASVEMLRDASGEPTGVLVENNRMPIVEHTLMRVAPAFDLATRTAALPRSMQVYNSFGTTSVFEGHGVSGDVMEAYRRVNDAGKATVRATLAFSPPWNPSGQNDFAELISGWGRWLAGKGIGDDWLRMNGLFNEIDGSPEQAIRKSVFPRTGWAGFNDAGLPREAALTLLRECARNGIRAIGIVAPMLDLFAEVNRDVPISDQRWVFGHVTAVDQRQTAIIRDLGLAVTTHTNAYIYKAGAAFRDRVGREREDDLVPLRRLLDTGIPVGLATDNVPPTMWHPIWQAIARRDRPTGDAIAPQQALTREESLRCATQGGAFATFEEDEKGALAPDRLADIAVLDRDPLTCDIATLPDTVADITIVGGEVVFHRGEKANAPKD